MWPSLKASVDVLQCAGDSGVDPADRVLICMHLCPWGLLGSLNDPADVDRQLTELTDQPICRMAGLRRPVAGFRTHGQSSLSTFRCINAYRLSTTTYPSMSSFDATTEPACRLLYKPLNNAETAGCHMDVYTPAKRDGPEGYPVAM
jgi:hypothetical protein